MSLIITTQSVRDYLELNTPGTSSKYSDGTIGSNVRAATSALEHATKRYLADRPATTYAATTMLQALLPLPGFRTFTTVTFGGTTLDVALPGVTNNSPSAWAVLEQTQGVPNPYYIGLQFRPWRTSGNGPWYLADPMWWDKNLDSPYYPANWGGGYASSSMPNDLVVVGDGGYAAGTEPEAVLHAVKVLAAFYTMRPASILADVAITPAGGVLNYSQMPAEVRDFVTEWKIERQWIAV